MSYITLAFEPADVCLYGFEKKGELNKTIGFSNGRIMILYYKEKETYRISYKGETVFIGKIIKHDFFKELLKSINRRA